MLRTAAIVLVLGHHPPIRFDPTSQFAVAWYQAGWTGVNMFFVLSGFLIGGLLFSEIRSTGTLDVKRFMVRRAFKIWPPYYVFLALLTLIVWKLGMPLAQLAPFFFHVQNYYGDAIGHLAPHTWSLAVEEHFYLVLPLALSLFRPTARVLAPGFLLLAVLCAGLRFQHNGGFPEYYTHLCIDSLAFGVLLAFFYHAHRPAFDRVARHWAWLCVAGVALVAVSVWPGLQPGPWGCALVPVGLYLGYGAILTGVMAMPAGWFCVGPIRLIALAGFYSYSIYLFHMDFAFRIVHAISQSAWAQQIDLSIRWPAGMLCYVLLAIATGVLMSRCIEMPALALRDRLFPGRSKAIEASESESAQAT